MIPELEEVKRRTVRALQYLHYTSDGINRLGGSPISDQTYDLICREFGIDGNGGSDRESDYTAEEIASAEFIAKYGPRSIPLET